MPAKCSSASITDAALTPDPEAIVSRFAEEFHKYLYYVLLDPPAAEDEPVRVGAGKGREVSG